MPTAATLRLSIPQTQPPPAPLAPCPWLWRCHQCHIWYRLSTTRRCLECSHELCLGQAASSSSPSKKRKRAAATVRCHAEFDYVGWAARGAWKRTVLLNTRSAPLSSATAHSRQRPTPVVVDEAAGVLLSRHRRWLPQSALTTAWGDEHRALEHGLDSLTDRFAEKKEAMFVRRRHNCWLHCDFPSECHHAVYKAQQEGKPVLARARALDEEFLVKLRTERERSVGKGPSAMREVMATASGSAGFKRSKAGVAAMDEDVDTSSDSDSDTEFDSNEPSPPSSPPTEIEIIIGVESTPISPISPVEASVLTTLAVETDCSYTAPAFEIYTDDTASPPVSPITSNVTAAPIGIPTPNNLEEDDCGKDIDVFLASLHTKSARTRRISTREVHIISTSPSAQLQSFAPFDTSSTATTADVESPRTVSPISHKTHQQLERAYSEQAWFATTPDTLNSPSTPRSSRRISSSKRMLTLLGRRTSLCSPPPRSPSAPSPPQQPAAENSVSAFDDWEDSDAETCASATSSTLMASAAAASPPSSADESVDEEGDRRMLDEDEACCDYPHCR